MNADIVWSWVLKVVVPLLGVGLLALLSWLLTHIGSKTILQKALTQMDAFAQGIASDLVNGMQQAINAATADGRVTPDERKQLLNQLVSILKTSLGTTGLGKLEGLLGLQPGSGLDSWLRGFAADHLDAQIADVKTMKAGGAPAVTSIT